MRKTPDIFSAVHKSELRRNRSMDVQTPLTQVVKEYATCSPSNISLNPGVTNLLHDNCVADIVKAVTLLMMQHGLRITEAINISGDDIDSQMRIYVRGLKGSKNRIISPSFYIQTWGEYRNKKFSIGSVYDRFYFYRLFVKYGIYSQYGNNVKRSVTHSFRHDMCISLQSSDVDKIDIQFSVGHKAPSSTDFYLKSKNKTGTSKTNKPQSLTLERAPVILMKNNVIRAKKSNEP
jgi:integrase